MSAALDTWTDIRYYFFFLPWCLMFAILITDVWLLCRTSQTSHIHGFCLNRDGLIDRKQANMKTGGVCSLWQNRQRPAQVELTAFHGSCISSSMSFGTQLCISWHQPLTCSVSELLSIQIRVFESTRIQSTLFLLILYIWSLGHYTIPAPLSHTSTM